MGQQLAAGQLGDGQRVGQVQLEENIVAAVKRLLGPVRDEVPDSCVGHVDGAKQVRRRMWRRAFDFPQERIHVALLSGAKIREGGKQKKTDKDF